MKRLSGKRRASLILDRLDPLYAGRTTGLNYESPLQLLVATILSAQCTDERVNMVTPVVFARYRTAEDYAQADPENLKEIIRSTGFFNNKTKNVQGMARTLLEKFRGEVPGTMGELLLLPGVARKTANVVLAHAFGENQGIAVDTHVQRLAGRLRLSKEKIPEKIEADLMKLVPQGRWGRLSDCLIWHGRFICIARSPKCQDCVVADLCPSAFIAQIRIKPKRTGTRSLRN
jgi:endonuclease III